MIIIISIQKGCHSNEIQLKESLCARLMLNSFYGLGLAIFQMIISRKVQKNILNHN